MFLKRLMVILLTVCLGITVSACGKGSDSEPDSGSASPTSSPGPTAVVEAPTVDPKTEKHTISYFAGAYTISPLDGVGIKMINEKFNVDYKPTFAPAGAEATAKLGAMMAANDAPDVFNLSVSDANFVKWAQQGALLPLDDFIKNDPAFDSVPQYVWDQVRINGKIYGIPSYFPIPYLNSPIIRKDWLDKLGLKMPTNFKEFEEVATAFAKKDPDGNGKEDTIGLGTTGSLFPDFSFGAYWNPYSFYQKNDKDQYVIGYAAPAHKEVIQMYKNLYDTGVLPKDFVTAKSADFNNMFWKDGKLGIWYTGPFQAYPNSYETLVASDPKAEVVAIPPFLAPDGSQGFTGGRGTRLLTVFSAKLKDDTAKVNRVFEMLDFGRKFHTLDQRNPQNPDIDFLYGKVGEGYQFVDGAIQAESGKGKMPLEYLPDATMWPPDLASLETVKSSPASPPIVRSYVDSAVKMHDTFKAYLDPINTIYSENLLKKLPDLENKIRAEQGKIVIGQRPMSDYEVIIKDFMDQGGSALIDEVNNLIKDKNTKGEWQTIK